MLGARQEFKASGQMSAEAAQPQSSCHAVRGQREAWAGFRRAACTSLPFKKLNTVAENNTLSTNGATVSKRKPETPGSNTI